MMRPRPPAVVVSLAVAAGACAAPRLPPPIEIPEAVAPVPEAPPPAPPVVAARWFVRKSRSLWGPTFPEGTLALVGGRRVLVNKEGARFETAQAPEPLIDLTVVPVAGGAVRVVGVGHRGAYRFDDLLGPGTPLARGTAKVVGVDSVPRLVAVWTERERKTDFIDVDTGRPTPAPAGLPTTRALGLVFRSEQQGAGHFEAIGPVVTGDGGATWRPVHGSDPGDAGRVSGLRFRDGTIEAHDADGRPADIDVATATMGPFKGLPRPERDPSTPKRPPPRGDELPLAFWMRASDANPLALAVDGGALGPGGTALVESDGVRARVDPATGNLLEAEVVAEGAPPLRRDGVSWPSSDGDGSPISGHRTAFLVHGEGADGDAPHVEIQHKSTREKRPAVGLPGPHGKLSLMGPIEEDPDGALRFVLTDEHQAFMVFQHKAPVVAIPIPGATHALVHGSHGFAVGPARALASVDGGVSWSEIPRPPGLAEAVALLGKQHDADLAVSAFGARVGDLVRVGWGPAEPPPGDLPAGVTPVPPEEEGWDRAARTLVCTGVGPSKTVPPKGAQVEKLLEGAANALLRRLGATAHPYVFPGSPGTFVPSLAFAHDDTAHVWAVVWMDHYEMPPVVRTWSVGTPAWATSGGWLTWLSVEHEKAMFAIELGERALLVRVEADGSADTTEVPKGFQLQRDFGITSGRRGPISWVDGPRLMLWRWGEAPRVVLTLLGESASISAATPTPDGLAIASEARAFGVYRTFPLPAPGATVPVLGLDGWTRFDAAAEHPERLPACDPRGSKARKGESVTMKLDKRPLLARLDGDPRRTEATAVYGIRLAGAETCLASVWATFGEGKGSSFVRADLTTGKADGGGDEVRRMTCAWR